jgi:hypothetical protein
MPIRYTRYPFAVRARQILEQRGVQRTSRAQSGAIVAHTLAGSPRYANHHGAIVVGESVARGHGLRRAEAETGQHAQLPQRGGEEAP